MRLLAISRKISTSRPALVPVAGCIDSALRLEFGLGSREASEPFSLLRSPDEAERVHRDDDCQLSHRLAEPRRHPAFPRGADARMVVNCSATVRALHVGACGSGSISGR